MNQRTEALMRNFDPRMLITVYTPGDHDWSEAYLESHQVDKAGRILEGKPLKQETLDGLVDLFYDQRQRRTDVKGLYPANLLFFEAQPGRGQNMIWFRDSEKRHLFFSESLHIPSGLAWVPPMIYKVDRESLDVFALSKEPSFFRPEMDTPLLMAPFHNVSGEGSVCLGSARVKKPESLTYSNLMKYWEDMFWLSEFTHLAGSSNPTKTNLNSIWKKLVGNEIKWSELDELLPADEKNPITIEDIMP